MNIKMPVPNYDDDYGYKERLIILCESLQEVSAQIPEKREKAWLSMMSIIPQGVEVIEYIAALEKCLGYIGNAFELGNIINDKKKWESAFNKKGER